MKAYKIYILIIIQLIVLQNVKSWNVHTNDFEKKEDVSPEISINIFLYDNKKMSDSDENLLDLKNIDKSFVFDGINTFFIYEKKLRKVVFWAETIFFVGTIAVIAGIIFYFCKKQKNPSDNNNSKFISNDYLGSAKTENLSANDNYLNSNDKTEYEKENNNYLNSKSSTDEQVNGNNDNSNSNNESEHVNNYSSSSNIELDYSKNENVVIDFNFNPTIFPKIQWFKKGSHVWFDKHLFNEIASQNKNID